MAHEALKGQELDTVVFPIEAGKIREFAKAIHAPSKIYSEHQAASTLGYSGVPAPPTFAVSVAHWRSADEAKLLGIDLRRALHGEAEWEYLRPVQAGDTLTARRKVVDVTQREGTRGGRMTMIKIVTEMFTGDGELAIRQTDTIIERGEAQ